MNWRSWAYGKVSEDLAVLSLVPAERIFGGGSLEGSVAKKPFIVLSFGQKIPGPFPGSEADTLVVWAHDEPGDYLLVDQILEAIRGALSGQTAIRGGISCQWSGDSIDLSDENFGTITRNSTFTFNSVKESQA